MCGRYFLADDILDKLEEKGYRLTDELEDNTSPVIYPSQEGLYLGPSDEGEVRFAKWGFPLKDSPKLVINARSETASEKRMFRDSFENRRILIPMSGFFEWNSIKEKYTIKREDEKLMFVAGLLASFGGRDSYVMLTTASNSSMDKIHPRMPLILEEDMIKDWLFDKNKSREILQKSPANVSYKTDFQQLSFL